MKYTNYPLTTCSFSVNLDWKGFALSAMLYAPFRQYKNDAPDLLYEFPEGFAKAQPNVFKRWAPENAGTTTLRRPALHLTSSHNETDSDFLYTSKDYLRLKSCEFSYSLPKRYARMLSMSRLMFFVSGNNLFTFWGGDKRIDPETNGQAVYPIVKSYTIGTRVSF